MAERPIASAGLVEERSETRIYTLSQMRKVRGSHHTTTANRAYSVPKGVRNKENIKHLFTIIFSCYFVIPNPLKQKKSIGDLVNPIFFIFTQFL